MSEAAPIRSEDGGAAVADLPKQCTPMAAAKAVFFIPTGEIRMAIRPLRRDLLWEETGRRHGLRPPSGFLLGGDTPSIADVVTATL